MEKSGIVPVVHENWRTAKMYDWVWSDDPDIEKSHLDYRRISQLLYQKDRSDRTYVTKKTLGHCRTIVGTFVQNPIYKMETDLTLRQYPLGRYRIAISKNILHHKAKIVSRKECTKKETYFCVRVATGADPFEVYKQIFEAVKGMRAIRYRCLLLLKQERIMGKITEDILKIAKNIGIDHEAVLKKYAELMKNSEDEEFQFKVNEKLGDIIGTHGDTKRVTTAFGAGAIFQGFSPKQIEDAETTALPSGDKDEDES